MVRARKGARPLWAAVVAVACMAMFPLVAAAASSWAIVPSPNTSPTEHNILNATSCLSAGDCWVVGFYISGGGNDQTLVEHDSGSGWTIDATSQDTSTTEDNALQGVTCVSASDCWAVGYACAGGTCPFGGSGVQETLAEHYNGSAWAIVATPTVTGQDTQLYGVSCVTSSDCWAVGITCNGGSCPGLGATGTSETLAEHWNGSAWSTVSTSNVGTGEDNVLSGIACAGTGDCWAVGYSCTGGTCPFGSGVQQTLIEHWNGTTWSTTASADQSSTADNTLNSVSCASATDCWAAGYYKSGSNLQTLTEQDTGSGWSIVASPNTSSTQDNEFFGIACDATGDCSAVGFYCCDTSNAGQALIETETGGAWVIASDPSNSSSASEFNQLAGVSCDSLGDCAAVGDYAKNNATFQTLIEESIQPTANVPEWPVGPIGGLGAGAAALLVVRMRRRS